MNTDNSTNYKLSCCSTIREAGECWYYNYINSDNICRGTLDNVRGSLIYLIFPIIGDVRVKDLDHDKLNSFCESALWDGLKFSTVQHALFTLYRIYEFLSENKIITENKITHHFKYRSVRKPADELTDEQLTNIMRLAQNDVFRTIYFLLIFTEITSEECICLKWEDIDWENNEIHISRRALDMKSEHITVPVSYRRLRKIPMHRIIREMLSKQLIYSVRADSSDKNPHGYIFISPLGEPLSIESMYSHMRAYMFMADMPDACFYYFRKGKQPHEITQEMESTLTSIISCPPYKITCRHSYKSHRGELI